MLPLDLVWEIAQWSSDAWRLLALTCRSFGLYTLNKKVQKKAKIYFSSVFVMNRQMAWVLPNGDYHGVCVYMLRPLIPEEVTLFQQGIIVRGVWILRRYVTGKLHGSLFMFHKSGKMRVYATYKRGLMHGSFCKWDRKGRLTLKQQYKKGKCHGTSVSWRNNRVKNIVVYLNGKQRH